MKSTLSTISVVAAVMFAVMLVYSVDAYPMHFGEPSWYHAARVDCLVAACTCALVSIASALTSTHF